MTPCAFGIDVVHVPSFPSPQAADARFFFEETYSRAEQRVLEQARHPGSAATMYAVKEALLKALDSNRLFQPPAVTVRLRDLETLTDARGLRSARLHGGARAFAAQHALGIQRLVVRNLGEYALACVLLSGGKPSGVHTALAAAHVREPDAASEAFGLSQEDVSYCSRAPSPLREQRAAGRVAARWALCKALRRAGVQFAPESLTDAASVSNDASGRPFWKLSPELATQLRRRAIARCRLNISHDGELAVAWVALQRVWSSESMPAPGARASPD